MHRTLQLWQIFCFYDCGGWTFLDPTLDTAFKGTETHANSKLLCTEICGRAGGDWFLIVFNTNTLLRAPSYSFPPPHNSDSVVSDSLIIFQKRKQWKLMLEICSDDELRDVPEESLLYSPEKPEQKSGVREERPKREIVRFLLTSFCSTIYLSIFLFSW